MASAALLSTGCWYDFNRFEPQCASDVDCAAGQVCTSSVCHPDREWASWPAAGEAPTAFVVNEDAGTVTDRVTQLLWQRDFSDASMDWNAASAYCAALRTAGEVWRLPTRIELLSIVDPTKEGIAADTKVFPGRFYEWFWTSTPSAADSSEAWSVNFYSGTADMAHSKASSYGVRCVRSLGEPASPARESRYSFALDAVSDDMTGLTWQRAASGEAMTWAVAKSYCSPSSGWRLPTKRELETLVDVRIPPPAIESKAFPNTPLEGFWTSTIALPNGEHAWSVHFGTGKTIHLSMGTTALRVRCVR